jgi:predicted transposase YbfD/YdcC
VAACRARDPEKQDLPDGLEWLDGLAIDGKTVRNSAAPGGVNVKLFSALPHHEQVVIPQITVPEDTTEVTCVPALLNQVDLTGKTITMDAAHTQDATADYIHRVRDAGHIMTVKGNRPHLLEAIAARLPRAPRRGLRLRAVRSGGEGSPQGSLLARRSDRLDGPAGTAQACCHERHVCHVGAEEVCQRRCHRDEHQDLKYQNHHRGHW